MSVVPATRTPRQDDAPSITAIAYRPAAGRSSLVGHADFHLARMRMRILNCPIFNADGAVKVALPAAPQLDAERRARTGSDGRVIYMACLEFDDPQLARAFSDAAVEALQRYRPDLFGGRP